MRRPVAVHVNAVLCDPYFSGTPFAGPGVGITVELREIAAGYIDTDAMPFLEQITGRKGIDLYLVNAAGLHQLRTLPGIAIPHAQNAVGQIHCIAVRIIGIGRMHVDELEGKVGIRAVR